VVAHAESRITHYLLSPHVCPKAEVQFLPIGAGEKIVEASGEGESLLVINSAVIEWIYGGRGGFDRLKRNNTQLLVVKRRGLYRRHHLSLGIEKRGNGAQYISILYSL